MFLLELFEVKAVPQSSFAGELTDILYNLNIAGLIPSKAVKNPDLAYKTLESKAQGSVPGTNYQYVTNSYRGDSANRPEVNFAIIDPVKQQIVGALFLEKFRYGRIGEVWHVSSLAVVPEYRGQGLAEKLEAGLAVGTAGLTVKSGQKQTPGSIALWNKMANNPNIEMLKVKADRAGISANAVQIDNGKIVDYPLTRNEFLIMRPR